ncbi:hypothetical protein [Roseococcus pinisoli]|uniref:Uncharacterized protein n=1 Tax=Roseococcus pinisoli TaxID=2835040 RepID=A0ABS5QJL3_9PROT|nr:hypothetical protein [Roseococcus pinisoli]MBS7813797.1 hypothetical protein [Roseococcus pinisoli]
MAKRQMLKNYISRNIKISSLNSKKRESVLEEGILSKADDALSRATKMIANGERDAAIILLRSLPDLAESRNEAVKMTIAAAQIDPEFRELVAAADTARDARDFLLGEFLYLRCLEMYSMHYGYMTQYAHCLKEQNKYVDSEIIYRSALSLGGPVADLRRHITAVAEALGGSVNIPKEINITAKNSIDLAPTHEDVRLLLVLFLGEQNCTANNIVEILRNCPRRRDVIYFIINEKKFPKINLNLMVLLGEIDR